MAKRSRVQKVKTDPLGEYKKLEALMSRAKGGYKKTNVSTHPVNVKQSNTKTKAKTKRTQASAEGRNARKRFQRTLTRLEQAKQQTYSPDMKAQYDQQIREVERSIQRTYAPKGGWKTEEQRQEFKEAIKRGDKITEFTKRELGSSQALKNYNFQQQIKWASSANKSALSYISQEEVKAFYNITRRIWDKPDIAPEKRNQAIMDYFKTKDLETAFERAMSIPGVAQKVGKAMVNRMLTSADKADLTEEQRDYLDEEGLEPGQQTDEGSPTWAMTLPEYDPDKDWSDYLDGEGEE